ncbi:MAG: protoporphyrinogen oxidase [Bacteroidota bacterium]
MSEMTAEFVILGAGLTGLSAAYHLQQSGKQVLVLEKRKQAGGIIQTVDQSEYLLDLGANTAAYTPDIQQLVEELGLQQSLRFAEQISNTRYLCRDKKLHKVFPSPKFLLGTQLLSRKGKWQLLREPWRSKAETKEESVADFFARRLGKEAYEYMIEPVLGGIYAGDPHQMSMQAVMPRMQAWEAEHGSLFKGMMAARKEAKANGSPGRRICSFNQGMQELPLAIGTSLGKALQTNATVSAIQKDSGGYRIVYQQDQQEHSVMTSQLIWTLPAYQGHLLHAIDPELSKLLAKIPYVPMAMLHLGYRQEDMARPRDGFGFLVPKLESESLLGAIWNSSIFPNRAPAGQELFTLFVGGGRKDMRTELEIEQTLREAQQMFEQLMEIEAPAVLRRVHLWTNAIPQYGLTHMKIRHQLAEIENRHPGLHLAGNFRNGVSVGDCLTAGRHAAEGV